MAGAKIGSLNVDLTLETARFNKRLNEAAGNLQKTSQKIAGLGKAIAGTLAAAGVVNMISSFREMSLAALDTVGNLGEQAAAVGVSTRSLQEYRYAATQVNLTQKEMDDGLAQLTRRLGDAAQGVKEPAKALERLGISMESIRGRDAGEVLPLIAEGLSKISSPAERAAITVDLFGRSGQKMAALLEGGAAGVDKYRKAANDLGVVISDEKINSADKVADKLAAMNTVIEAQKNAKLVENAEAILQFESSLGELKLAAINGVVGLQNFGESLDNFTQATHENLVRLGKTMERIALAIPTGLAKMSTGAVNAVRNMVTGIETWLGDRLNAVWNGLASKIQWAADKFRWLDDVVVRHSYIPDMVDSIGAHMKRLDDVMVAQATRATSKTAEKFRDLKALMDRLFPENRAVLDFQSEMATLTAGLRGLELQAAQDRLRREFFGLNVAGGTISPGADVSAPSIGAEPDPARWQAVLEAANGVIDTGKRKWGEWQEAANYAYQELSYQLSGLLRGAQSLADALRNVVARLADMAISKAFQMLGTAIGIPAFATGTNFAPGGLALVGERGPELVDLPRGSRVHTANETSRVLASGGGSVTMNVYTPNADSFRQSERQITSAIRRRLGSKL